MALPPHIQAKLDAVKAASLAKTTAPAAQVQVPAKQVSATPTTGSTLPSSIQEKLAAARARPSLMPASSMQESPAETAQLKEEATQLQHSFKVTEDFSSVIAEGFNPDLFLSNLQKLKDGLEAKAPGIMTYLADINKNLVQYQELTHILSDEKLQVIFSGLLNATNTELAKVATKKGSKKVLSQQEAESLF